MDKQAHLLLLVIFSLLVSHHMILTTLALEDTKLPNEAPQWAKTSHKRVHYSKKESTTHLQFYFHDTFSGKNASAVRVAQAPISDKSPTLFGAIVMADDPLTVGPSLESKLVGRAQGIYGSSGQQEAALIMAMSFCFTEGIYNGSCLSTLGRNPAANPIREITIVGGCGLFRMARGYAIAHTYWFNNLGDAIVGYNVTVLH